MYNQLYDYSDDILYFQVNVASGKGIMPSSYD